MHHSSSYLADEETFTLHQSRPYLVDEEAMLQSVCNRYWWILVLVLILVLSLHQSRPYSADEEGMLQRVLTRQSLSVAMINTGYIRDTSRKSQCNEVATNTNTNKLITLQWSDAFSSYRYKIQFH